MYLNFFLFDFFCSRSHWKTKYDSLFFDAENVMKYLSTYSFEGQEWGGRRVIPWFCRCDSRAESRKNHNSRILKLKRKSAERAVDKLFRYKMSSHLILFFVK